MARRQEAEHREREKRRVQDEAKRRARAEHDRERRFRHESMRLAAATLAINSGLIDSAADFDEVSDSTASRWLELASLARQLAADLRDAGDEAAAADRGEEAMRTGTGLAGAACLLAGSFWLAAGLGGLALASREVSRDWKRSRAGRYRKRWEEALTAMNDQDAAAFAKLFAFLQPREAALLTAARSA